jgi:hypothetical protein
VARYLQLRFETLSGPLNESKQRQDHGSGCVTLCRILIAWATRPSPEAAHGATLDQGFSGLVRLPRLAWVCKLNLKWPLKTCLSSPSNVEGFVRISGDHFPRSVDSMIDLCIHRAECPRPYQAGCIVRCERFKVTKARQNSSMDALNAQNIK